MAKSADHEGGASPARAPAAWLVESAGLLPSAGRALDVACGAGRHALWLARRGLRVEAVDSSPERVRDVAARAAAAGLPVTARVLDLEQTGVDLGRERFDAVVVVHYLHRPLFATLLAALRPGGVLVYETFTRAQARRGRPTNPAFLLEPGELPRLVAPLAVLRSREGDFEGRSVASVVARKG